MRTLRSLIAGAAVASAVAAVAGPAPASAQGYGPAPGQAQPEFGFVQRRGLTFGASLGFGVMTSPSSDLTQCFDCRYQPIAGGLDAHVGLMLNPRLAVLFEASGVGKPLDEFGTSVLLQVQAMAALQYWVTPQAWLKGGLGVASLQVSYGDGGPNDEIDAGGALLLAAGFEVLQAPDFAVDLSARVGVGSYDGIGEQVNTLIFSAGVSWYR